MNTFYALLSNALIVAAKNNFVWFALVFWLYLQTQSVLSTSLAGGLYLLAVSLSGFWLGSLVDHHSKKNVMLGSSVATFVFFFAGLLFYSWVPAARFTTVSSWELWGLILLLLGGVIAGTIYNIAVPTLVTVLVPEEQRDKANGMFGTVMGIAFAITSVASGVALAYLGMWWVLVIAVFFTVVAFGQLWWLSLDEKKVEAAHDEPPKTMDIAGTVKAIRGVPGLFALIFFTTFNNFLGGVFMALMDAYGLSLVSVQTWGFLWGVLSMGFIIGGLLIAKYGLGNNPLHTLFRANIALWTVCIFFTVQPSVVLLVIGIFIWICLAPFIEAVEQTIIQKVVPPERQGRVFGFAHSVEQAASPLTAFIIGPITQWYFIPFMTTGAGVELLGSWYGVGPGRGMALVFSLTGIIGLVVTVVSMRSKAYRVLYERYAG
jgi:DHA3 family multidrug efflux protein-like MFS transporter